MEENNGGSMARWSKLSERLGALSDWNANLALHYVFGSISALCRMEECVGSPPLDVLGSLEEMLETAIIRAEERSAHREVVAQRGSESALVGALPEMVYRH